MCWFPYPLIWGLILLLYFAWLSRGGIWWVSTCSMNRVCRFPWVRAVPCLSLSRQVNCSHPAGRFSVASGNGSSLVRAAFSYPCKCKFTTYHPIYHIVPCREWKRSQPPGLRIQELRPESCLSRGRTRASWPLLSCRACRESCFSILAHSWLHSFTLFHFLPYPLSPGSINVIGIIFRYD